jgi:hypothetical protein
MFKDAHIFFSLPAVIVSYALAKAVKASGRAAATLRVLQLLQACAGSRHDVAADEAGPHETHKRGFGWHVRAQQSPPSHTHGAAATLRSVSQWPLPMRGSPGCAGHAAVLLVEGSVKVWIGGRISFV